MTFQDTGSSNYFDQFDGLPTADQPLASAQPPAAVPQPANVPAVDQQPQSSPEGFYGGKQHVTVTKVLKPEQPPQTERQPSGTPNTYRQVPQEPRQQFPQPGGFPEATPFTPSVEPPVNPSIPVRAVTPDVTPSEAARVVQTIGSVASDISKGMFVELTPSVLRGVLKAADNTTGALLDFGDYLDNSLPGGKISVPSSGNATVDAIGRVVLDPLQAIKDGLHAAVGFVPAPTSATGHFIEGTSQFFAGLIPALRVAKAMGMSGVAADTAAGFASAFLTTDPNAPNLIKHLTDAIPSIQGPVTQYLATDPNDPQVINRLRNGLEMAGMGVLTDYLLRGLRFVANAKRAQSSVAELRAQDAAAGENINGQLEAFGKPDQPLTMVRGTPTTIEEGADAAARKIGLSAVATELGVPADVAARGIQREVNDQLAAREFASMRDPETGMLPLVEKNADGTYRPVNANGQRVYINLAKSANPEDVRQMTQNVMDALAPSINAIKDVKTWDQTSRLADNLGVSIPEVLANPPVPLSKLPEYILANLRMLDTAEANLWSMVDKAALPTSTVVDQLNFRRALGLFHAIGSTVLRNQADVARALGIMRMNRTSSGSAMMTQIREMMESMGGEDLSRELAHRMQALRAIGQPTGAVLASTKRPWLLIGKDMLLESTQLGLLWRPTTHIRNMVGNLAAVIQQVVERGAASRIDSILGRPVEDAVAPGEAMAYLYGIGQASRDMLRLAGQSISRGVGLITRTDIGEGFPQAVADFRAKYPSQISATKFHDTPRQNAISSSYIANSRAMSPGEAAEFAGSSLGRTVDLIGSLTRTPGAALGAEDLMFKTANFAGELNSMAIRSAAQDGLTGKAFRDKVADLVANPPDWLKEEARKYAAYATFNKELGPIGNTILRFRSLVPPVYAVAMFLKTPMNLAHYVFAERSPLALMAPSFYKHLAAGGPEQSLALARFATGSLILSAMVDYANSNLVTGATPNNPALAEAYRNIGWQPYSIYVPGLNAWISYNNADPATTPIAMAASIVDTLRQRDLSPQNFDSFVEVAAHSAGAIAQSVIDKSYFASMAQFVRMMEESPRQPGGFENWVNRQPATFQPFSSLTRMAVDFTDPVHRDASSMWEYVQAQLPLLSQKLIPARNVWGYERIKEHPLGAWYDFLSPFRVSRDSGSVVDHELVRLQTGVQPIGWKDSFMGVQVDFHDFPQVLDRYRQLAGHGLKLPQYNNQGAKEFLDSTISGKGPMSPIYYQNGLTDGPDGTKAAWIKNVVSDFRQEAQREVMREAKTKFPQFYDFIHQQQLNAAVQKGPAYILPPGFKVPQQAAPAVGGTPTMAPLQ